MTNFDGVLSTFRQADSNLSGECYRAEVANAAAFRLKVPVLYAVYSFRQWSIVYPRAVFNHTVGLNVICDLLIALSRCSAVFEGAVYQTFQPFH